MAKTTKDKSVNTIKDQETIDAATANFIFPSEKELYQKTMIAAMQGLLANPSLNLCSTFIQPDGIMSYTHFTGVLSDLADAIAISIIMKMKEKKI
jgi:hypothetical protein